jgi:hypothetical protein
VPLSDAEALLLTALRAQAGGSVHARLARHVVLWLLLAQALASAQHLGPPHPARRAPGDARPRRQRRAFRESLAGRRPRG